MEGPDFIDERVRYKGQEWHVVGWTRETGDEFLTLEEAGKPGGRTVEVRKDSWHLVEKITGEVIRFPHAEPDPPARADS